MGQTGEVWPVSLLSTPTPGFVNVKVCDLPEVSQVDTGILSCSNVPGTHTELCSIGNIGHSPEASCYVNCQTVICSNKLKL